VIIVRLYTEVIVTQREILCVLWTGRLRSSHYRLYSCKVTVLGHRCAGIQKRYDIVWFMWISVFCITEFLYNV